MKARHWVNIILLFILAYGSYGILTGAGRQLRYDQWQYFYYLICPWYLLWGGVRAWHRSYVWRRMLADRQRPPALSRGQSQTTKSAQLDRPGILEHASFALCVLAVAAILKQLSIPHAAWWLSSFIGALLMLRFSIGKVS